MSTTAPSIEETHTPGPSPANLVIVVGTLSSPPRLRDLPSGSTLASLELTTAGSPRESVPVSVFDPPSTVVNLCEGEHVAAVGRVRRRFYRAGGVTQSRTEVVAERVARIRVSRSRRRLLAHAEERLAEVVSALE